jgi:predicted nucleotidyltransferase
MLTKDLILNFFTDHKDELREKYSLVKVGLFGSYAKGSATLESDIDIYAEFEDKKFKNIAGAWNYFEEAFGTKIDLLYPHKNMRDSLKQNIEREVIYG